MQALGLDIGGSGIKGAIVDTRKGELVTERVRIPTPKNAGINEILPILEEIRKTLEWKKGPIGIGFPGVIRNNTIFTSANLSDSMIGINFAKEWKSVPEKDVLVLNDADSAGCGEMEFGAGKPYQKEGTVLLLTIGTGIGTVLFRNGILIPNIEFGHVEYKGYDAETHVSDRARKKEDLSWKEWGKRFNGFLKYTEFLLNPDFIIIGGGGARKPHRLEKHLNIKTPWEVAHSGNHAGIIGAAVAAAQAYKA